MCGLWVRLPAIRMSAETKSLPDNAYRPLAPREEYHPMVPAETAITEVLVTGEKGGSQARLLLEATAIAGIYDFFVTTFQVWRETFDLRFLSIVDSIATKTRAVFRFDAIAFILGLGYVMGLRSSMVLCAGGLLSNFVLVPLVWMIGRNFPGIVY